MATTPDVRSARRSRAGRRSRVRRLGYTAPVYLGQARRALAEATRVTDPEPTPTSTRTPAPGSAAGLALDPAPGSAAGSGLGTSSGGAVVPAEAPALRYLSAHLAALRGAAAVLADRGRPEGRRPGTAWTELAEVAPELEGWASVFAACARLRETADTGLPFPLDHADVDGFCRSVAEFLDEVEELLGGGHQTVLPTAG